jgi:hypothetical protein
LTYTSVGAFLAMLLPRGLATMFNVQPELGFNVSPAITPGFRVGLPEDLPGFRIDKNGSVRRMFGGSSNVPAFDYDPYGNARLTTSLPTGFSYPGNASSGHYLLAFDPVGSRWSSRDTFGENTDVTKTVYPYVGGNPASQAYPTGQSAAEKPSTSQNTPGSTSHMFAGSDRDAAWEKCHPRCVAQTVGKDLPDSFGSYRKCMRACMNSYGFFGY